MGPAVVAVVLFSLPIQSWSVLLRQLLRPEASCGGAGEPPCTINRCEAVTVRLAHAVTSSTSGRNLAEWETAETTCTLEPYKSTSLSPIDTSNGDVLFSVSFSTCCLDSGRCVQRSQ